MEKSREMCSWFAVKNGDKSEAVLILEGPPPSIVYMLVHYTSGISQKALRYHEMTAFPWPKLKTSVEIYNRKRRDTLWIVDVGTSK